MATTSFNAERFREALSAHNMKAREFAALAGVSEAHVSKVARGIDRPCYSFIAGLKAAFPMWDMGIFFTHSVKFQVSSAEEELSTEAAQ
jgi:transcriptional regulator with XRE-family HTH domain